MIDLSRARIKPYQHQFEGTEKLILNPYFGLFDEMGAGKTKQVIDAACFLFTHGEAINKVLVICPAAVRPVWFDPELGELKKHLWDDVRSIITEYHSKVREWTTFDPKTRVQNHVMRWTITNYDFIRKPERYQPLIDEFCDSKTLLVLDESSAVKSHRTAQTKACIKIRKVCGRVVLLNGTPIANNPLDMFSQGWLMNPTVLSCSSYIAFRARYAIMGGFMQKQIIGWQNLEDMQRRFAPYVLRRLKTDCLDLPPKLPSVALTVPLSDSTWSVYKEMREDLIAWLDSETVAVATQAGVKAMRLAQICSGFVGGLQDPGLQPGIGGSVDDYDETEPEDDDPGPQDDLQDGFKRSVDRINQPKDESTNPFNVREVGREKLDLILGWLADKLHEEPDLKLLLWCRFRPALARLHNAIAEDARFQHVHRGTLWGRGRGNQLVGPSMKAKDERARALRLLDPRTAPKEPVVVLGTPATGSMGLNLTASHYVIYESNDVSLKTRLQSEDRVHRPGQVFPVSYFDIVATGPQGQRTIDHTIQKALRSKEDLANWTMKAWLAALKEEVELEW